MQNAHALSRRHALVALAAGAALPGCTTPGAVADSADDPALRAAIAGPQRSAANRARDGARHPYETLRFFGLLPTHTVLEAAPGGGWYTEILAPYLRDRGRLVAAHYATDDAQESRRKGRASFEAKLAAGPALYSRVVVGTLPTTAAIAGLGTPGSVDLVVTFRNLHNWLEDGHLEGTLRAFASLLKPGGVLGVVDHRAAPGTSLEVQNRSGYVTEQVSVDAARAVGLVLEARSEINANPRDTRDHVNGVWALPPTLRGGDVDRARFVAIGESDRFTHRYRKPA